MTPLSLTLKGFRGIRDGLGCDELTLDLERLADGARLIAIAGTNGRGKTTIMDNLTPYLSMPSRAATAGPGGFSYYDHVFLPESQKELKWAHEGRSYRSQVVVRMNGRRRTEAFLHSLNEQGCWEPVRLEDGTMSDGKIESYEQCVEAILGSAETFFTSVFSAQGKRHLTTYKNAEIKSLLADLLGLERIREQGTKASETAKLLKTGLSAIRQEHDRLQSEVDRAVVEINQLGDTQQRITVARGNKEASQRAVDASREALAKTLADKAVAMQTEGRRTQLQEERRTTIDGGKAALATLDQQERRESERLAQLDRRIAQRITEMASQHKGLMEQRGKLDEILHDRQLIEHAVRRLPMQECVADKRESNINALRLELERRNKLSAGEKLLHERIAAIEREAGQAALKAQELTKRFGLTDQVPCAGTDLQGQCKLLGDAHEAKTLMPSADAQTKRLEAERHSLIEQRAIIQTEAAALAGTVEAKRIAEIKLRRTRNAISTLSLLAGRQRELTQANEALATVMAQILALPEIWNGETEEDTAERRSILQIRQDIVLQRATESTRHRESLGRIDAALIALPAPFDELQVTQAQRTVDQALHTVAEMDAAYMVTMRDQQRCEDLNQRRASVMQQLAVMDGRIAYIEKELGGWMLFAKCMGNDGLIALSIDDAGPTLAGLANDLLLACYGARFTVSINTLVETGKGEQREGFDIVVHDAESTESKSVSLMSGGERTWIDACLVRAVALYLKMNAGRCYATLFSDEADGPLDAEHKRMFMTMKREVLRLGGYAQEYFVSQTPELTAMADAIIDLDAMALSPDLQSVE